MSDTIKKILITARKQSFFRAKDIRGVADPRSTLRRMVARGELDQVGRGLYALPDAKVGANHSIAEAVKKYPGGIVCLISALFFYDIGTQIPHEIWLMRQDKKKAPTYGTPVRFVYCTKPSFVYGIQKYAFEGIDVQIYSPAKTVADCFKYRNKIGLDIALEALREGWRSKRFTMDELWKAAQACRVQKVMQPYLEMLLG